MANLSDTRSDQTLQEENGALRQRVAHLERIVEIWERHHQESICFLLNSIPAPVFLMNREGTILRANHELAIRMGETLETIIGKNAYDLISPEVGRERKKHVEQAFRNGQPVRFEDQRNQRYIDNFICPIPDEAGNTTYVVVYGQDITEHRKTEEALRIAQEDLEVRIEQRTAELTRTNAALQAEIAERQRVEQQLRFQAYLLDSVGQAIIATSLNGTISYWNQAAEKLYGWKASEVVGRLITEITVSHTSQQQATEIMTHLQNGKSWSGEFLVQHRTGYTFPVLVHDTPIYDESGALSGIIGVSTDISRRKEAEQRLIESEERYRTLVETSPDAILLTDIDGTIRFCNQQAARLFGYPSASSMQGKRGSELVAPDYLTSNPLTHIQQIVDVKNIRNIEYSMYRRDGTHFPAEISSSVITDQHGSPAALIIVVHDISNRQETRQSLHTAYASLKELNEDLRHSRNLLRALFDGLNDGLLLLDNTGSVQAANRAMATLLDTTPEDLILSNWSTIHPRLVPHLTLEEIRSPSQSSGHHHHQSHQSHSYQHIRYQRPDGSTCILNMHIITLYHPNGEIDRLIVHVVDDTEPIQLQARLIETERFAAGGRLAASVAHEINTPLQALKNSLYLAHVAPVTEREQFLSFARDEIRRIGHIVNRLLDLYRPGVADSGPINFNELIERIVLLIGKQARDQSVIIEHDLDSSLPIFYGRTDEMMQVLLNLMVNALDAMSEGGKLFVRTALDTRTPAITIEIHDTGKGIPPENHQRIFEPFFSDKPDGTGLGLAISLQIVEQHGGTINVCSKPANGSTFRLTLPPNHTTTS